MRKVPYEPRTLQTIFVLIFFSQLAFLAAVLIGVRQESQFYFSWVNALHWALPSGVFILDYLAAYMFRQRIDALGEEKELIDRIIALQSAYIVQWVMVQAGTFLILVLAMAFHNDYFTLLAVFQILYYSTLRPRLYRFSEET